MTIERPFRRSTTEQPGADARHVVVGLAIEPQANRQAKGHYGMALGWLKRGRVKQAILGLEKALEVDPTYLEVYLELARIYLQQRRWCDLNALCQRGLRYFLEIPELHKLMITALEEHGSLDDAYNCYDLNRRDARCLDIGPDEILCCVTVRNERARLPWFLDYHRRLGVDRFLFIDNGSGDGTGDWLLGQPDVHLWGSRLAFKRANFGSAWFELLLRRYGVGHWCLTVDVDEFLLFEGAPERSVHAFCRDLDRRGMRAATGVLLDLYSDRPIRETVYYAGDDPLALCSYFDRRFYHQRFPHCFQYRNQTIYFGGVRVSHRARLPALQVRAASLRAGRGADAGPAHDQHRRALSGQGAGLPDALQVLLVLSRLCAE